MNNAEPIKRNSVLLNIIIWGTVWGIFEATVGYLLHLISFGASWLIWYPVACFFMANVYRKTGRVSSIISVGMLCACIKLFDLLLPTRIDKVINPAISIIFEALSMAAVIFVLHKALGNKRRTPLLKGLAALGMNTGWRLLFILYLLFIAPGWIREVSVVSGMDKFIPFFVTQNLITSLILYLGYQFKQVIFRPIEAIGQKIGRISANIPNRITPVLQAGIALVLVLADITLVLLL